MAITRTSYDGRIRTRTDKVIRLGEPERHEQQAGPAEVIVVLVDDRDPVRALAVPATWPSTHRVTHRWRGTAVAVPLCGLFGTAEVRGASGCG
ncbi:hypothetical protein ABZ848_48655 [Streptomyces sp. NPDC047081]|uniref:hypothetical protein n=1 Tax=Streptomyces sp. NPDC047081 TaxID=3154706 RepID=UPI003407B6A5